MKVIILVIVVLLFSLSFGVDQGIDAHHRHTPTPRSTATTTPSKTSTPTATITVAPTHTPFCYIVRSYIGGQGTLVNQWTCVDEYPAVTGRWNVILPAGITPH